MSTVCDSGLTHADHFDSFCSNLTSSSTFSRCLNFTFGFGYTF